jgi:methylthioribose-1-phosphate isomerase
MSQTQGGPKRPPSSLKPPYQTIKWGPRSFWVLDQRELPSRKTYLSISDIPAASHAIQELAVRGAPLIGVAAALAIAHAARKGATCKDLLRGIRRLARTRPTAFNLFVALERMKALVDKKAPPDRIVSEALTIWKEEEKCSLAMAEHGAKLVSKGMRVGTYCNTGALAAPGLGTALGVIIYAHLTGKDINVMVPETRPLLQGARLTAWELSQWKIPYTLITESALASVVGKLDVIFVGADRIAANGDTANKIGTQGLAILAKYFNVPFYVVAPSSTLDLGLKDGLAIPIEHRSGAEVRKFGLSRTSPRDAPVANPAFDVTPASLISGIVTERGVLTPPYEKSLEQ